jgi:hypothetical protein
MAGSDEETFEYDVFISHSSDDKPVVRQLAERLRSDGLRVWLDEWIIQPGDSIPLAIENGLEQSRTLILCMSANSFASEWVTLERHTVMFRDPTNLQRRFIPLRLDGVAIKDTLKQFAYVDWQHQDSKEYERLRNACYPSQSYPSNPAQNKSEQPQVLLSPFPLNKNVNQMFIAAHTSSVLSVAFSLDGTHALSGSFDRTVKLWELDSGLRLKTLESHTSSVWSVA